MKIFPLLMLSLVVGCGDDDGVATDAPPAAVDAPIDGPPVCGISSTDFGDLGERAGTATMQGGNGNGLATLFLPLTAGDPADRMTLDLWGGTKHHPGPIVAGSFELTGIQTANQTCTVCVLIGAQWPEGGAPNFDHVYMVTGGTANITMIDPNPGGVLEVEFTNLVFQHVSVGGGGVTTPLNDGCVSAVDHISFAGAFESDSSVAPDDQVRISPADLGARYLRQ